MSSKYKPTEADVLAALRDNHRITMTVPDLRRAIQAAHNLPMETRQSRRWSHSVEVSPVSDAALRHTLTGLVAGSAVVALAVRQDPAVSTPWGASEKSTLYLTTEDYASLREEWTANQVHKEQEAIRRAAEEKARNAVLEKYADEVADLTRQFLAETGGDPQ